MSMIKLMKIMLVLPLALLANSVSQAGKIWYVNARSGSDFNSGFSSWAAKATIQAAVDASMDGDTILVAPGTYLPIETNNKAITIQSLSDAFDTIIDGEGTSRRCVTARCDSCDICTNSVVIGFTLQNGEACLPLLYKGEGGGCVEGGSYRDCILLNGVGAGGGNAASAVLENCFIIGGYAYNGGNVLCSIVRNCTMIGGYAEHNGGAYYNCAVYNSICYGNDSGWRWGADKGTSYQVGSWNWGPLVEAYNGEEKYVYKGDPNFVDVANGDYRLAAGSPCIDAGDNSYVTTPSDLLGNIRIANGTVDIGCCEY